MGRVLNPEAEEVVRGVRGGGRASVEQQRNRRLRNPLPSQRMVMTTVSGSTKPGAKPGHDTTLDATCDGACREDDSGAQRNN